LMMDAETLAQLKLHLVPGLGPKTTEALLVRFETAERVLRTPASELATVPHISEKTASQFVSKIASQKVDEELELIAKHGVQLLYKDQAQFPSALREIPTAPQFLYCKGSLVETDARSIAIVGSRHCTNYGQRAAVRLAEGLARAGWTIVSGLARGIDAHAHQGALKAGGRTIGVLAGGLAKIYPPEHTELANEITRHGAVLSEMPMGVAPLPELFPRRNRIISGVSRAVIIVEAAAQSGALITARLAAEQGREVLAVPGPIDSECSAGPHQLIRQGATLVRSVDDVLEVLGELPGLDATGTGGSRQGNGVERTKITEPPPNLSPVQLQIWQSLGSEGALVDDIVTGTALNISEINSALMMMELTGRIKRLPGNRFARKA
jgi:DNA processing protein